jgi:hypothetical protein
MNRNYKFKIRNSSKGQIVLIVLLVSTVIMSIGLSLSRKAVSEIKVDVDEELSKKAFDTAESAIDYYDKTDNPVYTMSDESGSREARVTVSPINVNSSERYTFETTTAAGNTEYFWLVNHNEDDSLGDEYYNDRMQVCLNSGFAGAVKIDYFYLDAGGDYKVKRYGYNIGGGDEVEGFATPPVATPLCSEELDFSDPTLNNSILIGITPVFANGQITIVNLGDDFPDQGTQIVSTGNAGDADIPINRIVSVNSRYKVPGFLMQAIAAEGNISN